MIYSKESVGKGMPLLFRVEYNNWSFGCEGKVFTYEKRGSLLWK
jgi:hypothetical protein